MDRRNLFLLFVVAHLGDCLALNCNLYTSSSHYSSDVHFILLSEELEDCQPGGSSSGLVNSSLEVIEDLNSKRTSSFTLGLQVIPACNQLEAKGELAKQLYSPSSTECEAEACGVSRGNSSLIGVIGPDVEEFQLMVETIPYIILGEEICSKTSISCATSNALFHAGVTLEEQAEFIAVLLLDLNVDYTTVIYTPDKHSASLMPLLRSLLTQNKVCVEDFLVTSEDSSDSDELNMNSAVSDGKPRIVIALDVTKLPLEGGASESPESMTQQGQTQLSIADDDIIYTVKPFRDRPYLLNRILTLGHTAYANVSAQMCSTQEDCQDLTGQQLESTFASALETVISKQGEKTVRFDNRRLVEIPEVHPFQQPKSLFSANEQRKENMFWCTNKDCQPKCAKQITPNNYVFVPGNYIIVVTTPIHDAYVTNRTFWGCSEFNGENSVRAEAVLFAREQLSKELDLSIGLLVLDTCYNTALTLALLTDVFNPNGTIEYCFNGTCLDRSKIVGLIGDLSSHIALSEQELIIHAKLLQVSYGSATSKLDDEEVYPNFMRIHSSSARVTTNVVQLLDNLTGSGKAEINSVVLVHTDTEYGRNGAKNLEEKLTEANYCISIKTSLSNNAKEDDDHENEKRKELLERLKEYNESLLVIYFGEEKAIREFLKVLTADDDSKYWWRQSGSIFLFPEIWENRQDLLKEFGQWLRGSLSLKVDPKFEVPGFKEHLESLHPDSFYPNPWIVKTLQERQHCKLRGDFSNSDVSQETRSCTPGGFTVTNTYTINLIKAMYAFWYGFHEHSQSVCDSQQPCEAVYNRTERNVKLLKMQIGKMAIPQSDDESKISVKAFDSSFDGVGDYNVYSMQYINTSDGLDLIDYVHVYKFLKSSDGTDKDNLMTNDSYGEPKFYVPGRAGSDNPVKFQGKDCKICSRRCEASDEKKMVLRWEAIALIVLTAGLVVAGGAVLIWRLREAIATLITKLRGLCCGGGTTGESVKDDVESSQEDTDPPRSEAKGGKPDTPSPQLTSLDSAHVETDDGGSTITVAGESMEDNVESSQEDTDQPRSGPPETPKPAPKPAPRKYKVDDDQRQKENIDEHLSGSTDVADRSQQSDPPTHELGPMIDNLPMASASPDGHHRSSCPTTSHSDPSSTVCESGYSSDSGDRPLGKSYSKPGRLTEHSPHQSLHTDAE